MRLEYYEDKVADSKIEYRWRIVAENGEIVAASSEGFASKANAVRNYDLIRSWFLSGAGGTG